MATILINFPFLINHAAYSVIYSSPMFSTFANEAMSAERFWSFSLTT